MLEQIENRTLSKRLYIPIATTPWNNISTIRISVSLRSPALTYSQLNLFHSIRLGKQLRPPPPPFTRYLPPCPFAPFVWRGKSNLRNCPHRESSKFAQPAEENFSLFSFHFFSPAFSRVRFGVCVSVCVCRSSFAIQCKFMSMLWHTSTMMMAMMTSTSGIMMMAPMTTCVPKRRI